MGYASELLSGSDSDAPTGAASALLAGPAARPRDPEQELANALARLRVVNPGQAESLIQQYGPDLVNPSTLSRLGIQMPKRDRSTVDKLKRTGGSVLLATLDLLDRPVESVKGLITEGPVGAWQGLSGQKEFQVLAPETGGGTAGTISRFVEDVALDPLMYVTFGTAGVAKAGLKGLAQAGGKGLADAVAKGGVKAVGRDTVEAGLLQAARGAGVAEESVGKLVGKQLSALEKGAQGGIKFGGHTVAPGSMFSPTGQRLRAALPVAAVADKVGGPLRRTFTPRAGITDQFGREASDEIGHALSAGRAQGAMASEESFGVLGKAIKGSSVTDAELTGNVRRALEGRAPVSALSPEGRKAYDELDTFRRDLTDRQLAAGVLAPEQVFDTSKYVPIEMTDAGREALRKNPDGAKVMEERFTVSGAAEAAGKQGGHLKQRRFQSTSQAEKAYTEIYGPLKAGKRYVEANPARALAKRAAYAERAIGFQDSVGRLLKVTDADGGRLVSETAEGVTRAGSAAPVAVKVSETRTIYAHPEIAGEINKVQDVFVNDQQLGKLLETFDQASRWWKSAATVPLVGPDVGFFSRNGLGNVTLAWLGGLKNPERYARAARIQVNARGTGEALSAADRVMLENARREGVIGAGFFNVDTPARAPRLAGKGAEGNGVLTKAARQLTTEGVPVKAGRGLNSAIEDNARLALFIDASEKGMASKDAAMHVKKHLFDYGDLTSIERNVLRRAVPFYTFMRKTVGVHADALVHQPGKVAAFGKAQEAAAGHGEMPAGALPQYAVDRGDVPVGGPLGRLLGGGDRGVLASPELPVAAAAKAIQPIVKLASLLPGLNQSRVSPEGGIGEVFREAVGPIGGPLGSPVKALTEVTTGKSFLSGRDLAPDKSALQHIGESIFPTAGKVRRQGDKPLLQALTGISVAPLTDQTQASETYRRLDLLEELLRDQDAPTLADLRKAGIIPKRRAGVLRSDILN